MGIEQSIVLTPKSSLHIARKLWHSGTGALGIAFFQYSNEDSMFLGKLLVIVALVAFVLEWYRLRNDALNKVSRIVTGKQIGRAHV